MKGIEISKAYWESNRDCFYDAFPNAMKYAAIGLLGSGSEVYGFDDEISKDHDFEPGFCIFLPSEELVDRQTAFKMQRMYQSLPKEFLGLQRTNLNPAGGNRHGVFRTSEFFKQHTGIDSEPKNNMDYLALPDYALFEIGRGNIFEDNYGEVTDILNAWKSIPKDVVLKKLAGYLILMSQSGEYNLERCRQRKDEAASLLCAYEFTKAALASFGFAYEKPLPYYKWQFKALEEIEDSKEFTELVCNFLKGQNDKQSVKKIIELVLNALNKNGLLEDSVLDIQDAALRLNNKIKDNELRNANILFAV